MSPLVPNRFLFHFEFPLNYRRAQPKIDGDVRDWSDEFLLPRLGEIDGRREFAEVWASWNDQGLCVACRVLDKRRPVRPKALEPLGEVLAPNDPRSFWTGDNLRICTDMRDARTVKRATRFCQQFYFLPTDGGADPASATAGVNKFQRAREDAPHIPSEQIAVAAKVLASGYSLEAHIPADCLIGFDPVEHPRIGFYYILEDGDHGQQYLTVGDDLYWYADPSTWATAVFQR